MGEIMRGHFNCYRKKKSGTCLKEVIDTLDLRILEKKNQYDFIQEEIKALEKCLSARQYESIMSRPLRFYDVFSWQETENKEMKQPINGPCPYLHYGCEAVYELKKRVLNYHSTRLSLLVDRYNQMIDLTLAMREQSQKLEKKEQTIICFGKQPSLYLGYSEIGDFKLLPQNSLLIELYCMQNNSIIIRTPIQLIYKRTEDVLKGTHLKQIEKDDGLFKIQIDLNSDNHISIEPMICSVQEVIRTLKKSSPRYYRRLIGSYLEIGEMTSDNRKAFIQKLHHLGYQAIGQVKDGQYQEEQLLVSMGRGY